MGVDILGHSHSDLTVLSPLVAFLAAAVVVDGKLRLFGLNKSRDGFKWRKEDTSR